MAVDQGLVLRSSQVPVVVGHTGESVHGVDVARVQYVAHPQVDVQVGGLCCLAFFAVGDGEVAVEVGVQTELPRQAASIDRAFGRWTYFACDGGGDGGGRVRRS